MVENKFKIGQKVIANKGKVNAKIFQIDGMYIDLDKQAICYHSHNDHSYTESELELVKEKKKVALYSPIYRNFHKAYETSEIYHSEKSYFDCRTNEIVGWHELVVEVDDE